MKKWVIVLIVVLAVLLVCCGVGAFAFYKFFRKATAERSAYEQVQEGQDRTSTEDLMGGSGINSEHTANPPAGTDCRTWVDRGNGRRAFEICFANGVVVTKDEYQLGE